MNGMTRAVATLFAAAVTGLLLWIAGQFDRGTTGGYWAALGLVAAGGLLFGLAQVRGAYGNPRGTFLVAFLPVAIATGWILVAAQPHSNWFADHVGAWSRDLGIAGAVATIAAFLGVLAFGLGFVLGVTLEPARARRSAAVPTVTPAAFPASPADARAAEEPTTAERHEQEAAAEADADTRSKTTTRTVRG
jgi:hypothetical protein